MNMKNIILLIFVTLAGNFVFADDIEATVTNADEGEANGAIDLTMNGGVAPFEYSWEGPGGFTSSEEDLTDLVPGIYTLTVKDLYCGIATFEVEVEEENGGSSSSISEETLADIAIYPNPTSGLFFIRSAQTVDVKVYNLIGKVIVEGTNVKQVDLHGQPAGIYMVQLKNEQGVITRKVTLQ